MILNMSLSLTTKQKLVVIYHSNIVFARYKEISDTVIAQKAKFLLSLPTYVAKKLPPFLVYFFSQIFVMD